MLALVAAGCGNDDDDDGTGVPTVIATTSIWADVVANVACDGLAEVVTVIPPGGDPHAFQPSLSDRENMENAALIVANGLFLEEGLEDTIDAVEDAGTPVFRVADHVSVIEFGSAMGHDDHDDHEGHDHDEDDHDEDDHDDHEGHDHDEDEHEDDHDEDDHDDHEGHDHDEDEHEDDHEGHDHDEDEHEDDHDDHEGHDHDEDEHEDDHEGHDHDEDDHDEDDHDEDDHDDHAEDDGHGHAHAHGSDDPHVWFDPIRVADALPALSQALATQAGLDAAALDECVAAYRGELIALDAEVDAILSPLHPEDRLLVTNHDALGYFADRYGFQVIGTVIPSGSTLAAASPAGLQELVELIDETGVAAIFSETTHSSDDTEALGREAGVQVVSLNTGSLGPADSSSGTYVGFIRTNAQKIAEGLG
ncbi:metal ABC transporter substrate-binding protein [Candidatus Poriferisocius sp.]|uniref:metal ABC transporter substrate-binding protein n=1 Tax=Candidatus Poriferisocius sp. TaxID=3101276 RepID=UPI003B010F83